MSTNRPPQPGPPKPPKPTPAIISTLGVSFIKQHEDCILDAYQDQGGVWTIGWGATGVDVKKGLMWTQQQADNDLDDRLATLGEEVAQALSGGAAVNQNQFDALCSFSYNLGIGALRGSHLLSFTKLGFFTEAVQQFPLWDNVNGKPNKGVLARRKAEAQLFSTPVVA